jgi:hypothetical protein
MGFVVSAKAAGNESLQRAAGMGESGLRNSFIVIFCFLTALVGLILILQASSKVLRTAGEAMTRPRIRRPYAGITLASLGFLFLAVSLMKSTGFNASDLANSRKDISPARIVKQEPKQLRQEPISVQQETAAATMPVTEPLTPGNASPPLVDADNNSETISGATTASVARTEPATASGTKPADVAVPERKQFAEVRKGNAAPTTSTTAIAKSTTVSLKEKQWMLQLQKKAAIYGRYPSAAEMVKYNHIQERLNREEMMNPEVAGSLPGRSVLNRDLSWAFELLRRTRKGYQPSQEELSRYEKVVSSQIGDRSARAGAGY